MLVSISGKEMVFRVGASYDWKQTLFGAESWLNVGIVGWRGNWPLLAQPLIITDFSTIRAEMYWDAYGTSMSKPWAVMLYLGFKW